MLPVAENSPFPDCARTFQRSYYQASYRKAALESNQLRKTISTIHLRFLFFFRPFSLWSANSFLEPMVWGCFPDWIIKMVSSQSRCDQPKKRFKYDVFLSFKGPDTHRGFTDHLYVALHKKGIFAFRDDDSLKRGETICDQLVQVIQDSRMAVVVLSQNYASSPWRLEELVKIIQCKKVVLPIFYEVQHSDVRHQKGAFGDAFKKLEERSVDSTKVQKWKEAPREVANLSRWQSTNL